MPSQEGIFVSMDETTSFDLTQRQTINPLIDELNKQTEPLLKAAMNELGYELPLYVRLYNQIRFYETYGKLKLGVNVASKETLAKQFGVTIQQIDRAYNNLTTKYKVGHWVEHNEPVFRNVKRTWMSSERLKSTTNNYYSVVPELLQQSSDTTTLEYLASEVAPLSESKKKVSESKNSTNVLLATSAQTVYGKPEINELFSYWLFKTGIGIEARKQQNRNAANNLLRKYGSEKLKQLIDGVAIAQGERYAPQISDFCELQEKLTKLLTWGKNRNNDSNVVVIS